MVILAVSHFLQFCFIRKLRTVRRRESVFKTVDAGTDDDYHKADDQGNSEFMERRFNWDNWWFWIISGIVEIVVLALYFTFNGDEYYFIFWVPTDAILFTGMFGYYMLTAY